MIFLVILVYLATNCQVRAMKHDVVRSPDLVSASIRHQLGIASGFVEIRTLPRQTCRSRRSSVAQATAAIRSALSCEVIGPISFARERAHSIPRGTSSRQNGEAVVMSAPRFGVACGQPGSTEACGRRPNGRHASVVTRLR